MKSILRLTVFLNIFVFSLFSCKKEEKPLPIVDDFSSPVSLFVDQVTGYTTGVIPGNSEIQVKLTKPLENISPGSEENRELFTFDPEIPGKTYWQDAKTVVFAPQNRLKSGQYYKAIFNLGEIVAVPDNQKNFRFTFQCIPQNFSVKFAGIELYDVNDLSKVKLSGIIQTADVTEKEIIQRLLVAKQDGEALSVSWEEGGGLYQHKFTIENIKRKEKEEEVTIEWDGAPLDVKKKGSTSIDIPGLNEYKVMNISIVRGDNQYILVNFSDPIDEKQNLTGMISLGKDHYPRVVVDMNQLKIYPIRKVEGAIDLTIQRGIKNTAGFVLEETFEKRLSIMQEKPQIRFLKKKGAILPGGDRLPISFEAVSLRAIDFSVVRIFDNNVLQYLQVNDPGDSYNLVRVGKPVFRREISLEQSNVTDLDEWNQFTFNLADYMQTEPGAFYQIRLSFRQSQSTYFCPGADEAGLSTNVEEAWAYQEASAWDWYEDQYYYYDWKNRDNPCSPAYYRRNRAVKKIMMASNLGIIAKKADKGPVTVLVTDMITTRPIKEVVVELYDYQQQLLATETTDNQGKAVISASDVPFFVMARKNEQVGYLKLNDGSSLSLSSFDVSGQRIQKGIKGFIYGERGVWRPGDPIFLSFMLEDENDNLPDEVPVILELEDPMGKLVERRVKFQALNDVYTFKLATDNDAPTGKWMAKVKAGGATFYKYLKIETIKPNRLKINIDFGVDRITATQKFARANLDVRWLHGAIAKNLKAEVEMLLTPGKTTFSKYPDFIFDDKSKNFNAEPRTIYQGRLDSEGHTSFSVPVKANNRAPGALKATFKTRVYEEGGDFSIDSYTLPMYPYSSFVGIKVPEGDRRGMLVTDKDHSIRVVTVDADGNPIDRRIRVDLYKLNWRWWWDRSYDPFSSYVGSSYRDPIQTQTVSTHNGEGEWKLRIDEPEWGRFYIRMTDPVSGHSTGNIVYLDWPGWAGKQKRGQDGVSMLDFQMDKETVKVGEKVALNVPSSEGGRILVSIESGSKVLQTYWAETQPERTVLEFETTTEMTPNVYVHLTLLQPHIQTANDLPLRMYGVSRLEVVDPETKLAPVITIPEKLTPEKKFTVKIGEKNNRGMTYTLAIVDEGLLDLTRFATPDPWRTFYAREALGVKTWDLYDDVIGATSGKMEPLTAIGGDEEIKALEEKDVNRFKPVVLFAGPFELKPGKSAEHTFTMPQYIGSVRTMVIARQQTAYGSAEATTPVKQPLMILATLPRVAGPGESLSLPVNVFAMNDQVKNVKLSVKASGKLQVDGPAVKTISFEKAGDQVVFFKLKASQALGSSRVTINAESGALASTYEVEMMVRASNPEITDTEETLVNGGESWNYTYEPLGLISTNNAVLEVSSLPPLNLNQRLRFLISYPHGCVEQTTSSVFAQLYLNDLLKLDDETMVKTQKNINAAIQRLKSFQLTSGGFSFWPGNSQPNFWGTNYAGHFLVEAGKKGYNVPVSMLSSWISFQQTEADNWSQGAYTDDRVQAYRLYTLALAGSPAMGAMNRMKADKRADFRSRWTLAAAYAISGFKDIANDIVANLTREVDDYREPGRTYGSKYRDKAMILEALVCLERGEDAFVTLRDIAEYMGNSKNWMSTQTTAYCLLSIAAYAKAYPPEGAGNIAIDISGNTLNLEGKEYLTQVVLQNPDRQTSISLQNKGLNTVFVRMIRTGIPLPGNEIASEKNIRMTVLYKSMDGEVISIDRLPQGQNFKAEILVQNPGIRGDYEELAITQIFPSGWEIINTRLDETNSYYQQDLPEYQDIRDDRVMTYFDLAAGKRNAFTVLLNASYQGKYYLPATEVEAMYDNSIHANSEGKWVEVFREQ